MHAGDLSAALWDERAALERFVAAVRSGRSLDACDAVLEDLRAVRLVRDVRLEPVLRDLGHVGDVRLEVVLRSALPAPWDLLLPDHVAALRQLAEQVDGQARDRPGSVPERWDAFAAGAGYR